MQVVYNLNNLSDADLVSEYCKSGNKDAMGILYKRYTHLVLGVCIKYLKNEDDAYDATIQIFEKLIADIHKHKIDVFKNWLYTVSKNHCLMHLRAQQSKQNNKQVFEKEYESVMELSYDMHLVKEKDTKEVELNKLDTCMEKLNREQQLCVKLFYIEEKCYQEIAGITNYTLNNVKSYIQNGKRNLKNCMSA